MLQRPKNEKKKRNVFRSPPWYLQVYIPHGKKKVYPDTHSPTPTGARDEGLKGQWQNGLPDKNTSSRFKKEIR